MVLLRNHTFQCAFWLLLNEHADGNAHKRLHDYFRRSLALINVCFLLRWVSRTWRKVCYTITRHLKRVSVGNIVTVWRTIEISLCWFWYRFAANVVDTDCLPSVVHDFLLIPRLNVILALWSGTETISSTFDHFSVLQNRLMIKMIIAAVRHRWTVNLRDAFIGFDIREKNMYIDGRPKSFV